MPLLTVLAHNPLGSGAQGWGVLRFWTWDNTVLILGLLAFLYWRGLRNWPKPRPMDPWRPFFFYGGLAIITIALMSPIDELGDDLFLAHMVQHQMLMTLGIPLALLGAPTTPLLRGLPRWARHGVVRPMVRSPLVRGIASTLTFPPLSWLLFTGNMWAWHFVSGAFESATRHGGVHFLQHACFAFSSALFWWAVIDPRPLRSRLPYPLRVVYLGVTMFSNVALGAAITFSSNILYPYYATRPRLWGITPGDDQQAGGLIMWVVGDMTLVGAVLITLLVWFIKEDKKNKEQEAALARVASRVAVAPVASGPPRPPPRPRRATAYWKDSGPPRS